MSESDKRINDIYLSFSDWSKYIANEAIKKIKKDGYSVFFSNNGMTFGYETPNGNVLYDRCYISKIKSPFENINGELPQTVAEVVGMSDELYVKNLVDCWKSVLGNKDENCLVLHIPFAHSCVLGWFGDSFGDSNSFSTMFGKFPVGCELAKI